MKLMARAGKHVTNAKRGKRFRKQILRGFGLVPDWLNRGRLILVGLQMLHVIFELLRIPANAKQVKTESEKLK